MYLSTPNVLTLAPKGAERSDNPWHVHEYRAEEFERLCRRHFARWRMFGLFHARKLRAHELALRAGWDGVHARLGLTKRFYDWFTPAIAASDFVLRPRGQADLDRALDFIAVCRYVTPASGCARRAQTPGARSAIVLHTHMPYVEGFGTWPFGEEWLWEAMAGCYLPLLDLLDAGAPLTLSLTPVLCDQLEAPGVAERFASVRGGGAPPHARGGRAGLRAGGHETLAREVERSWGDYERALERFAERGGGPAGRVRAARAVDLLGHARGAAAARHRRGRARAGPDRRRGPPRALRRRGLARRLLAARVRATRPGWSPALADAGVRAICVELTSRFGLGAREHLRPLVSEVGRDARADRPRDDVARVERRRLPGQRRLPRLPPPHRTTTTTRGATTARPTTTSGRCALASEHAADFVARTRERLRRDGAGLPGRRAGGVRARHRAARALVV